MSLPVVLIDSSFLYALFHQRDPDHARVKSVIGTFVADFIIPPVVLTEVCFLFNRAGGSLLTASFLRLLANSPFPLEPITQQDIVRASIVLNQHSTGKLEFVDCCILAMSERLQIAHVATLDRRDFSILRKASGEFLHILPE